MITQCPKCLTSFRATEVQLTIASGAVRCGSCLHVFNAASQRLNRTDKTAVAPLIPSADPQLKTAQPTALETGLQVQSDSEESPSAPTDNPLAIDAAVAATVVATSATTVVAGNKNHHPDLNDDDIFDRIFDQELEPLAPQPLTGATAEPSAQGRAADDIFDPVAEHSAPQDYIERSVNSVDVEFEFEGFEDDLPVSLALDSAEELTTEPVFSGEFLDLNDRQPETVPAPSDPQLDNSGKQQLESPPSQQPDESQQLDVLFSSETMVAGERIGQPNHDYLARIEPAPVAISAAQPRNPWIARSWLLAIAVGVLTLLAQAVYFNIDSLARGQSRAALVQVCAALGCELPTQLDLDSIRSSKLMVRSHPDSANALVVDAIINNGASFSQPFPAVELLFTAIDGSTVARRVFTPREYLHGELSGSAIMPSRQPVYIAFELVDPGPEASNYQLLFRAN